MREKSAQEEKMEDRYFVWMAEERDRRILQIFNLVPDVRGSLVGIVSRYSGSVSNLFCEFRVLFLFWPPQKEVKLMI